MDALSEETLVRLHKLGGQAFVDKMIDLFLDFGGGKIKEAREALARQEFNVVGKAGHALKSSAGNVGALRLMQAASAIEQQAPQGDGVFLTELLGEMEAAFEEVRLLLEAKKNLPASGSSSHE